MEYDRKTMTGITHEVHVRKPDESIQKFSGVLDVMKMPGGDLKFNHDGDLKQFSDGEVMRCRVTNLNDAHKYVCPECESDDGALITASDRGGTMTVDCMECEAERAFERRKL